MDIRLQVFEYYPNNNNNDNYFRKSFRFIVVDFSKAKNYPQNFVCILPLKLGDGKSDSAFVRVFKEKSLEQAKALLKDALEREDDSEIKAEIERRLLLLEPKDGKTIKCSGCGKLFQAKKSHCVNQSFKVHPYSGSITVIIMPPTTFITSCRFNPFPILFMKKNDHSLT